MLLDLWCNRSMLYVQESVGSEEELIHVGQFNFMYTVQAMIMIFLGVLGSLLVIVGASLVYKTAGKLPAGLPFMDGILHLHPYVRMGALGVLGVGLMSYAQMMVRKATTEIAITDVRLIYKRGVIARQVGEISIDRIEGVTVLQSILGRMFNYGRVAIRGMGVGQIVLPPIEDPVGFRQAVEEARTQKIKNNKG